MSQMSTLLDKLLDQVLQDDLYQRKQAELEHKLEEVQEKLAALEHQQREGGTLKARTEQIETRLREGGFEKATVACMLEELDRITLFPECMEMTVSLPNPAVSNAAGDRVLRIEYGSLFHYMQKKQEEREVIIHLMQEKPQITAKIIAEKLGLSLSGANYRINALKKAGRIRFRGSGGKGTWEILG